MTVVFSARTAIIVTLVAAWTSWLGYNGLVSVPAFLMMGAVFVTDAQPGSVVYETFRWVTDTSASFMVKKNDWNVAEYIMKGAITCLLCCPPVRLSASVQLFWREAMRDTDMGLMAVLCVLFRRRGVFL